MPLPPLYSGTQDDSQIRSIDNVHINPSIMEGEFLVSSLYGRLASAPLYRFPPTNTSAPTITGETVAPGRLICSPGQWIGSPYPRFDYQWMSDGVDIPGANEYEYFSTLDVVDTTITCEVRGYTYMGEGYAISNSIVVSLIEPIEIIRMEEYLVQGLENQSAFTMMSESESIITGVAAPERMDMVRGVALIGTGTSAPDRNDILQQGDHIITGLQVDDTLTVLEHATPMVIWYHISEPLEESVALPLPLKNNDAELGVLGWDIFGSIVGEGQTINSGMYPANLSEYWAGGDNVHPAGSNIPFSYMWQDVPMFALHLADINADLTSCELSFFQKAEDNLDQGNVKLEFYNSSDILLKTEEGDGLMHPPEDIWWHREVDTTIPANTAYIRVIAEFLFLEGGTGASGASTNNNTHIDSIHLRIRKGPKLEDRDFGPSFEQWRVRFTQASTWSGTALSEVILRDAPGGLSNIVGGSPIFGSAGLGNANANEAFDGLKDGGFWAGAENAVTADTAWIGYDYGVAKRPQELELTARPGSDAFQMGRQFYIEGSDDGASWTKVQHYTSDIVPTFASGESVAFPIPSGAYPKLVDEPGIPAYPWTRSGSTADNDQAHGNLYQSKTRMNIDTLHVLLNCFEGVTESYELQLYRASLQKNSGGSARGMITEHLETVIGISPDTAANSWQSLPLLTSHEFGVDDYFVVRMWDAGWGSNLDQAWEARTFYHTRQTNSDPLPGNYRKNIAFFMNEFDKGGQTFGVGQVNPGSNQYSAQRYFAVDFSGTVF